MHGLFATLELKFFEKIVVTHLFKFADGYRFRGALGQVVGLLGELGDEMYLLNSADHRFT